jgi:SNF2 family DNA or RNA helicase
LFNFVNPGLLGSNTAFHQKYLAPIEKENDKEARYHLQKLIKPFILRRRKSEVLQELPSKTEITLHVDLSEDEKAFYDAYRLKAIQDIEAGAEEAGRQSNNMQVLAEITKLRQLSCNIKLIEPDTKITSSKLQLLQSVLEEILENNHQVLIFSQFVSHLALIRESLDESGIKYQYLDGQTPIARRKERVDAFQKGDGDVFLISLRAGGTGLNLTAADYVIHMDPWWNPAVEDQASDRVHRIGQQRPVTIYRLVSKETIEEKIIKLHQNKRDLAEGLLEGTDKAGKINIKELLSLMKD